MLFFDGGLGIVLFGFWLFCIFDVMCEILQGDYQSTTRRGE